MGSYPDFSLFLTNPALIRVSRMSFDEVSDLEYPNSIPRPSSQKQAILVAYRRQCFINGRITLVNTKDAVLSPKGRTVKTK